MTDITSLFSKANPFYLRTAARTICEFAHDESNFPRKTFLPSFTAPLGSANLASLMVLSEGE